MEGEDRQQQGEQQQNVMLQEVAQMRPLPNQQCPRCQSMDTKFGYFNNNNIGQPRYLCKACKRYWTQGGKIRNIPPGGGVKKARRGELFRFDIPSPLPSVGLGAGGVHNLHLPRAGFGLPTQNFSRPQQITITRGNALSLLKVFKNGFNPVGQDQYQNQDQSQSQSHSGQDQSQGQSHSGGQDQGQSQGQSHPGGQSQGQVPNPVQGFADHPNGATDLWMQPPSASAAASTTNYPPFEADADVYSENIYNGGGNSGGSSSIDWSGLFSDFGPDF